MYHIYNHTEYMYHIYNLLNTCSQGVNVVDVFTRIYSRYLHIWCACIYTYGVCIWWPVYVFTSGCIYDTAKYGGCIYIQLYTRIHTNYMDGTSYQFCGCIYLYPRQMRGGGLGSRPKKMYGERLGDGVETHLMSPTPRR